MMAFGFTGPHQVAQPLPDILTRDRFTINATMPAGARAEDRSHMLRALLIDRFKLRYHVEHVAVDGFALTMARQDRALGPQLHRSAVDCPQRLAARARKEEPPPLPAGAKECAPPHGGPGSISITSMPIDLLRTMLSGHLGSPVADETGLSGAFDADLRYALPAGRTASANELPPAVDGEPSIFTAVQEQLGLRLVRRKVPVDRLVIDHAESPDPD
jgi:uncharacterized protein (TIGR03435 family)